MRLNVVAVAIAAIVIALASACGSHRVAQLGFQDCVDAWNGPDNAARRERVAASVVRAGYTRAGIQLSETTGTPMMGPDPNPVGCRVILFKHDRWVAFVARRDGDHFRCRHAKLGREEGDQAGVWPDADLRGPNNAWLTGDAKLALSSYVYVVRDPAASPWKRLIDDWYADGRIDGRYSCKVARAAVTHLPADGPEVGGPIRAYERKVC